MNQFIANSVVKILSHCSQKIYKDKSDLEKMSCILIIIMVMVDWFTASERMV